MITATKKQMIEFIADHFVTAGNDHPTASQLDAFKKDDLMKLIENSGHVAEFDDYMNSLS